MNKEQLDAIKARLEKYFDTCSIRESEMLAMHMGVEDVPALIAEVERLKTLVVDIYEEHENIPEYLVEFIEKEMGWRDDA